MYQTIEQKFNSCCAALLYILFFIHQMQFDCLIIRLFESSLRKPNIQTFKLSNIQTLTVFRLFDQYELPNLQRVFKNILFSQL